MARNPKKRGDAPPAGRLEPSFDDAILRRRISEKAYELYERRGRTEGHDVDDWLEAERAVRAELSIGPPMVRPRAERSVPAVPPAGRWPRPLR
jgi:hypothetical protein